MEKSKILTGGLKWFIRLRWLAGGSILLGALLFRGIFERTEAIALTGALILGVNLIFAWGGHRRGWGGRLFAHAQVAADWLALGFLAHLTGGAASPLIPLFIFHVIIASILLGRIESCLQTTFAVVLVVLLGRLGAERAALPWGDRPLTCLGAGVPISLLLVLFVFYATNYLAGTVGEMLKKREEELEAAYRALEREDEEKTRFLLTTAHGLKSPLAAVESLIQGLLFRPPEGFPSQAREVLERIRSRTANLSVMVKDLLVLASVRRKALGKAELVSLSELFGEAMDKVKEKSDALSLALRLEEGPEALSILGDREAWRRACENLLDNAVKYSRPGGLVTVRLGRQEGRAKCVVKDQGIGIPPEDLPRVFEEFYRAQNARAHAEDGTGLGLAIVRRIVEDAGGEVFLESDPGIGTAVTILLPLPEPGREEGDA